MRYIKIVLRDKQEIVLPFEKAEKLLDNPSQLIKLNDEQGNWTGETINKSEIIYTGRDYQKERDEEEIEFRKTAIEAPSEEQEEMWKKRAELLEKYKPNFLKKPPIS